MVLRITVTYFLPPATKFAVHIPLNLSLLHPTQSGHNSLECNGKKLMRLDEHTRPSIVYGHGRGRGRERERGRVYGRDEKGMERKKESVV